MSTLDKCPYCGAPDDGTEVWYNCGTSDYPDAGPSRLCRERAAHADTRAELERVRSELLQSRWASAGTAVTAEITRIQSERSTVDLIVWPLSLVLAIAAEERRLASVRCMEWVGALAQDWERRADEVESAEAMPGAEYRAAAMRQMAREMRLRAESESAPTVGSAADPKEASRE